MPQPSNPVTAALQATAVSFDFDRKQTALLALEGVQEAVASGRFVWIDVQYRDAGAAQQLVSRLGVLEEALVEDIFSGEANVRLSRYTECLHWAISGCRLDRAGTLHLEPVNVVMGEKLMLTLHEGPRPFMDAMRRDYQADFVRFAQSPSFLVYELWDNLVEHYLEIEKHLELLVQNLQGELLDTAGDAVFERVSSIGANLLHFRAVLTAARGVLAELSTRRSMFVSEATQAALANMVGVVDHILQEVLVDRDVLAQSLNLHMSMITHRTNRVMNKLTVVSAIFLPLTFLSGIYGMNFDILPELHWRFGYAFFWTMVAAIVVVLGSIMRRNKLL